ncbi:unnamed protein product [Arabis nemorensis]|uniref:Uncharacterized protein n=1 Tax=Arabis nemorensis TaxID=586526 RepID=A0A565AZF1_9BRAS|nr:unnamed protein product [Arabis nemorensis]
MEATKVIIRCMVDLSFGEGSSNTFALHQKSLPTQGITQRSLKKDSLKALPATNITQRILKKDSPKVLHATNTALRNLKKDVLKVLSATSTAQRVQKKDFQSSNSKNFGAWSRKFCNASKRREASVVVETEQVLGRCFKLGSFWVLKTDL